MGTGLQIILNSPNRILDREPKFHTQATLTFLVPSGGFVKFSDREVVKNDWLHVYFFRISANTSSAGTPVIAPLSMSRHLCSNSASQAD